MENPRRPTGLVFGLWVALFGVSRVCFGADWTEVNSGLRNLDVRVLAIDPVNPDTVYAGGDGGVYKSVNRGELWSSIGLNTVRSLVIDFADPNVLYAGTTAPVGVRNARGHFLFKSTDGGTTWSNNSSPRSFDFNLLVMDPMNPTTLYTGSYGEYATSGSVFLKKSSDGGETWTEPHWHLDPACCALAVHPTEPQILYAKSDVNTSLSGLFKSTDGGASWNAVALMPNAWVDIVTIDPLKPNTVYMATAQLVTVVEPASQVIGFNGLFKTIDGGRSWLAINTGLPDLGSVIRISAFVVDADNTNVLYAGTTGRGVFKSIDGGANWVALNDGLTNLNVRSLALTPGGPDRLYAGTSGGIFKLDDMPVLSLDSKEYCVTFSWRLNVSNAVPDAPVRLLGATNGQSWEMANWRKTDADGSLIVEGKFAEGTEGSHSLRVEIGGVISNIVSFVISRCTPVDLERRLSHS
ncbi:MAG TPA: hypothetical protein VE422_47585 [Terriglobia bacterium]|nr:hypothetical protein [Terriglobia bacterium]